MSEASNILINLIIIKWTHRNAWRTFKANIQTFVWNRSRYCVEMHCVSARGKRPSFHRNNCCMNNKRIVSALTHSVDAGVVLHTHERQLSLFNAQRTAHSKLRWRRDWKTTKQAEHANANKKHSQSSLSHQFEWSVVEKQSTWNVALMHDTVARSFIFFLLCSSSTFCNMRYSQKFTIFEKERKKKKM